MRKLKNLILKVVNKPTDGVLSSQTLYESLFYCVNSNVDFAVAEVVAKKIVSTQLENGGFDIGYDFQFGPKMTKTNAKEGTSPELLSLTALSLFVTKYNSSISTTYYTESIFKGLSWVKQYVLRTDSGYAIPYAPESFSYIHITNATSFCISAIASSLQHIEESEREGWETILSGMYDFMFSQLEYIDNDKAYWPYFYQNGSSFERSLINSKIDNYHIAQQLYHHCIAEAYYPSVNNQKTIQVVYNYLISNMKDDGFMPYTIFGDSVSDKIHLWGYSSLIPAFLLASEVLSDNKGKDKAKSVSDFIFEYFMLDDHFAPIVSYSSKAIFDSNFYPRSDAWVIHALSVLAKYSLSNEDIDIFTKKVFDRIVRDDFKGLENHVVTRRMKLFSFFVRLLKH